MQLKLLFLTTEYMYTYQSALNFPVIQLVN